MPVTALKNFPYTVFHLIIILEVDIIIINLQRSWAQRDFEKVPRVSQLPPETHPSERVEIDTTAPTNTHTHTPGLLS